MIGDIVDMAGRIKQMLPARWFSDDAPILDALLGGLGKPGLVLTHCCNRCGRRRGL